MTTPNLPSFPAPGVWPLKAKSDWRDFIHNVVAWVALIVGSYVVGFENSPLMVLWIPAVLGVLDAIFAYVNSVDGQRRVAYAVGGVAQLALMAVGVATEQQAVMIVSLAVTVVTSFLASKFTPTSPISPPTMVATRASDAR